MSRVSVLQNGNKYCGQASQPFLFAVVLNGSTFPFFSLKIDRQFVSKRDKERERQKASPNGEWSCCNSFLPFHQPVRIWSMYTCMCQVCFSKFQDWDLNHIDHMGSSSQCTALKLLCYRPTRDSPHLFSLHHRFGLLFL